MGGKLIKKCPFLHPLLYFQNYFLWFTCSCKLHWPWAPGKQRSSSAADRASQIQLWNHCLLSMQSWILLIGHPCPDLSRGWHLGPAPPRVSSWVILFPVGSLSARMWFVDIFLYNDSYPFSYPWVNIDKSSSYSMPAHSNTARGNSDLVLRKKPSKQVGRYVLHHFCWIY